MYDVKTAVASLQRRQVGAKCDLPGLQRSPGAGRFDYLTLSLSGKEDQAQSMRSNASGLGAGVALRVGTTGSVLVMTGTGGADSKAWVPAVPGALQ